eukprot:m.91448 g.91448  ORF g.91448 m.91448 type:complete len:464 (-) comp13304_c0_seq4:131-1522(-)
MSTLNTLHKHFRHGPCFPIPARNIKVLFEPKDFLATLQDNVSKASTRIVFASLYIGNGPLERDLLQSIHSSLERNKNNSDFRVRVHIDKTRGTRGQMSSANLLQPLLRKDPDKVRVSMYLAPQLNGWLGRVLRSPFNEVVGLTHMKFYVTDDKVVISGANLENAYFTSRQDRYIIIKDKNLCDYFEDLAKLVSSCSFALQEDGTSVAPKLIENPQKFCKKAGLEVSKFTEVKARTYFREDLGADITLENINDTDYAHVYPLLQMGPWNVTQDENVTTDVLSRLKKQDYVLFSTGYFNIDEAYKTAIYSSLCTLNIMCASPQANGFFGAKGIRGHVPSVYTYFESLFFNELKIRHASARVVLVEYLRAGWTFHAKGLWLYLHGNNYPSVSFIGSSNFGYRSTKKDLECQVAVLTNNETLKMQLHQECMAMTKHGNPVTSQTFSAPDRGIKLWEKLASLLLKAFF